MKKEKSSFIKQFKDILYKKGFTQQEFASKLGVDQVMISQWMNGARNPSIKSIKKIAEVLDVPVNYFLGESNIGNDGLKEVLMKINFIEEKIKRIETENILLKKEIELIRKDLDIFKLKSDKIK